MKLARRMSAILHHLNDQIASSSSQLYERTTSARRASSSSQLHRVNGVLLIPHSRPSFNIDTLLHEMLSMFFHWLIHQYTFVIQSPRYVLPPLILVLGKGRIIINHISQSNATTHLSRDDIFNYHYYLITAKSGNEIRHRAYCFWLSVLLICDNYSFIIEIVTAY